MTGWTVVTREPEWDDYARSEAIAAISVERATCSGCGTSNGLNRIDDEPAVFTAPDGRRFEIWNYRCGGCAGLDLVRRDHSEAHHDDKAERGHPLASDGWRPVIRSLSDPEGGDG